jgi:hypothetical protein
MMPQFFGGFWKCSLSLDEYQKQNSMAVNICDDC